MDPALGPLDLVQYSAQREKPPSPVIDTEILGEVLEELLQHAANLIYNDTREKFLYKYPTGWKNTNQIFKTNSPLEKYSSSETSVKKTTQNSELEENVSTDVPWCQIVYYEFARVVRQINNYIETWELSPATKYVVIAQDRVEHFSPFGEIYFVEVHFCKPTPKCPNPLAVAKVFFDIHISKLVPAFYPVNVIYRFEGYKTIYYVMGAHKLSSNRFQRYFIDSILHMKLSFYAELSNCPNALKLSDNT